MSRPVPGSLDPFSAEYVRLAFGLERLQPGFVDAYVGPAEERQSALAGDAPEPQRLIAGIQGLLMRVADSDLPPSRVGYLTAQLGAMLTVARTLAGEPVAYRDEVQQLFDVEAVATPSETLSAAITTLDELLPGAGSVRERMAAWRRQFEVSPDAAERMTAVVQPEIRRRTSKMVTLPEGEQIEYQWVSNQPWSGYNWYLGNGKSRVELNTDLPVEANRLLDLLCHEGYPGHHTEHALKERLYLDHGYGEHAIQLINTPECIISEGIATLAQEVIFPGDEAIAFQQEAMYPIGGIVVDPALEASVSKAASALRGAAGNAALMLHEDGKTAAEAQQYLEEFGLLTPAQAAKRLEFIQNPLWRAYIFTYHAGYDLLRAWLDAPPPTDTQAKFRVLLTEQVYPSMLYQLLAESEH